MLAAALVEREDWPRIIADLNEAGLSQEDIARLLGRAQSTVSDWAKGREPRHSDGKALLALHADLALAAQSGLTLARLP